MREKERQDYGPPTGGGSGTEGGGLDRLREQANRFLAAGDEAINSALDNDSEAFLRANRHQGGE
jgi:hypothetical protein